MARAPQFLRRAIRENVMTKTTTRFLFLAVAAAAALAALGPVQAAEPASVEITASPLRGLNPSEGEAITGEYKMSDGRSMKLRQRGRVIVADLDGEPLTRLLAQTSASGVQLQAADGSMLMKFSDNDADTARNVTVTLVRGAESPSLALLAQPARR